MKLFCWKSLIFFLAMFFNLAGLFADGCFLPKSIKWRPDSTLTEPHQRAVIVFDEKKEDLILQVKYEGDLSEFAWLVPLPSKPEVSPVLFSPFLNLSDNLSREKIFKTPVDDMLKNPELERLKALLTRFVDGLAKDGLWTPSGDGVDLIEADQISWYKYAIVKSDNKDSLYEWLKKNDYLVKPEAKKVLEYYIKKNFHFVIFKIRDSIPEDKELSKKLLESELPSVKLSFKTDKPFYPLFVSSINPGETELLIYLIAKELYSHVLFTPEKEDIPHIRNAFSLGAKLLENYIEADQSSPSLLFDLFQAARNKEVASYYRYSPHCSLFTECKRLRDKDWYLSRMRKKISTEDIKEDLSFSNDKNQILDILRKTVKVEKEQGYVYEKQPEPFFVPDPITKSQSFEDKLKKKLVVEKDNSASKWLDDKVITDAFLDYIIKNDLWFDFVATKYDDVKLRNRCIDYLMGKGGRKVPWYLYPIIRPRLEEYLDEPQISVCSSFGVLCYTRVEYVNESNWPNGFFFYGLDGVDENLDFRFSELKGLLNVPAKLKKEKERSQYKALAMLAIYRDPDSIRYLEKWLKDGSSNAKVTALNIIACSLQNNIDNAGMVLSRQMTLIRPVIYGSAYKYKSKIMKEAVKAYKNEDRFVSSAGSVILIALNDKKNKPDFREILTKSLKTKADPVFDKLSREKQKMFHARMCFRSNLAFLDFQVNRDSANSPLLLKLLQSSKNILNSGINFNQLYKTASLAPYCNDPEIKRILKENLK